jgi:RNA polymerase-binding transcription factor
MPTKKSASKKSSKKSAKKPAKKAPARAAKPIRKASKKKASPKKPVKSKATSRKKAVSAKRKPTPTRKKTIAPAKKAGKKPAAPASRAPKKASHSAAAPRRSSGSVLSGPVKGFTPYQPKRGEDYMNKTQLEHFRQLLLAWKRELMEEVDRTMLHMKDDAANFPDPNDRATQESEFGLELRTRDRERKLLKKIDSALGRIDDGSYGYCEETGDEIGLRRLEARPVATLCVEAQERRELAERQFRDREDQYR